MYCRTVDWEYFYFDVRWTWYGFIHDRFLFTLDLRFRWNGSIETTALVMTATIAYLALYQDEQEKAYQEIKSTIPLDSDPVGVSKKKKKSYYFPLTIVSSHRI